jgi:hypothetical protein
MICEGRMRVARRDELEARFRTIQDQPSTPMSHSDRNVEIAVGVLGEAVVRLEKVSTRLSWINIILAVVIACVGVIQIVVMLRGH